MKKLIIAEKPSLGKNIAMALDNNSFVSKEGYLENNEYIITWGFGHLFSLKDIEEYNADYDPDNKQKWSLDKLPFKPSSFEFTFIKNPKTHKADLGVIKQFNTIKSLCSRPDIEYVIHAGDADREGEIIIRIILDAAKNKKPVMRLWLPEQTTATIQHSLKSLASDNNYTNLAYEGYARTYIDWLYGINLTRLATIKSGKLMRVGRVIVPTVKAIYDRDMEIREFKSEKYWAVISRTEVNGIPLELRSKEKFPICNTSEASQFSFLHNSAGAIVTDKSTKEIIIEPKKLFSLSSLQGLLGSKYKMTPNESLSIIQKLYESGYVTYPRTNTEYLATAEKHKINAILIELQKKGFAVCPKDDNKSIYDDSKVESHSALTPTYKLARECDLTVKQWQVYTTILDRFLAVFCSIPCKANRTSMIIEVGDREKFKVSGDVITDKGWMMYEDITKNDKLLPDLNINDTVNIHFSPVEKETSPPKHYTVKTLGDYMKNPFRDIDEDDSDIETYKAIFEGVELGTEATRTGIIETAIRSGYISLKNNSYTILPAGEYYIETLEQLGLCLSKEKTAELGKSLKKVYRGEQSIIQAVNFAFDEIKTLFNSTNTINISIQKPVTTSATKIGTCPKCNASIVQKEKGFFCENRSCSFVIWKEDKFISALGKKVTVPMVKSLLKNKKIILKGCTSQKTGKKYDRILHADFSEKYPKYSISFKN